MNAPVWISRECDACGTSFRFPSNKGGKFMSECYPCASGNADPELQLIAHALYAVVSQAIDARSRRDGRHERPERLEPNDRNERSRALQTLRGVST